MDKSLKFYNVYMKRDAGTTYKKYELPKGYHFKPFKAGDEKHWAEIEGSVDQFDSSLDALIYFQKTYLPYLKELERRHIFIENEDGKKIATAMIWWEYVGKKRFPWIHWIAVHKDYQGLGLGKAIITECINMMLDIEGDKDAYLHTQTWSYKAIGIYKSEGFYITPEKLDGHGDNDYDNAVKEMQSYLR